MKEDFTLISSYDGLPLSVSVIRPDGPVKAVVQLSHGMRGCKERFLPVMDYLAGKGYVCVANDHRGHGGSLRAPEDLGYMYEGGWKALVSDMRQVTEWIRKEFAGLPVFLLGHSMGSLAARAYVRQDDAGLSGLIVCGSPSYTHASVFGRILTGGLCTVGLGRLRPVFIQEMTSRRYNRPFKDEGPQAWTCSDPEVRRSFAENPLCNFHFTANASYSLLCLMRETYSEKGWPTGNPDLPVLFLSGEDDPCAISFSHLEKSVSHMRRVGYRDVRLITYEGMRHEVLNERDKTTVWNDIAAFIESVIGQSL